MTYPLASSSNQISEKGEKTPHPATIFAHYAPAICQISSDEGVNLGTAFLIGRNLIMTCNHVIPTQEEAKKLRACFLFDQVSLLTGRLSDRPPFVLRLDPTQFWTKSLSPGVFDPIKGKLDYTIVSLQAPSDPKTLKIYNKICNCALSIFSSATADTNEKIYVIQHPVRKEQRISAIKDLAEGVFKKATESAINHRTDTAPGSSGSPLLNERGELLGLHRAGSNIEQAATHMNAIKKSLSLEHLQEIQARFNETLPKTVQELLAQRYLAYSTITPLIAEVTHGRTLPLKDIFIKLAIIEEAERKEISQVIREGEEEVIEGDIRIPTYESIWQAKKTIEIENLFNHETLQKTPEMKVLILGTAGVGKSTLCQWIAYQWASSETNLWNDTFKTIFWIRLRNLNSDRYPASENEYTAEEILSKECGLNYDQISLEREFLKESLLILDGYDEIQSEAEEGRLKNAFEQLKKNFPHILMTSRPQTVPGEWKCKLEILGFADPMINQYIDAFFIQDPSTGKKLRALFDDFEIARSLAHIPINLEIFCSLFQDNPEIFQSERTITLFYLYNEITNWLYKRYLKFTEISHLSHGDLADLSSPRLDSHISYLAQTLERVAYEAMKTNKLYLPQKQIERVMNTTNRGISTESLMLSLPALRRIGPLRIEDGMGHFIHLTFQEFLAGVYLAERYLEGDEDAAKAIVSAYKFEPRFMRVFAMTAGYLSENDEEALKVFFDHLIKGSCDFALSYELELLARCFEECRDPASQIPHWTGFVQTAVAYIEKAPSELHIVRLLQRNVKLFNEPNLVEYFHKGFFDENETRKKRALYTLKKLVEFGQPIPEKIRDTLMQLLDPSLQEDFQKEVSVILREISKTGVFYKVSEEEATKIMDRLIDFTCRFTTDRYTAYDLCTEVFSKKFIKLVKKESLEQAIENLIYHLVNPTTGLKRGNVNMMIFEQLLCFSTPIGNQTIDKVVRSSLQKSPNTEILEERLNFLAEISQRGILLFASQDVVELTVQTLMALLEEKENQGVALVVLRNIGVSGALARTSPQMINKVFDKIALHNHELEQRELFIDNFKDLLLPDLLSQLEEGIAERVIKVLRTVISNQNLDRRTRVRYCQALSDILKTECAPRLFHREINEMVSVFLKSIDQEGESKKETMIAMIALCKLGREGVISHLPRQDKKELIESLFNRTMGGLTGKEEILEFLKSIAHYEVKYKLQDGEELLKKMLEMIGSPAISDSFRKKLASSFSYIVGVNELFVPPISSESAEKAVYALLTQSKEKKETLEILITLSEAGTLHLLKSEQLIVEVVEKLLDLKLGEEFVLRTFDKLIHSSAVNLNLEKIKALVSKFLLSLQGRKTFIEAVSILMSIHYEFIDQELLRKGNMFFLAMVENEEERSFALKELTDSNSQLKNLLNKESTQKIRELFFKILQESQDDNEQLNETIGLMIDWLLNSKFYSNFDPKVLKKIIMTLFDLIQKNRITSYRDRSNIHRLLIRMAEVGFFAEAEETLSEAILESILKEMIDKSENRWVLTSKHEFFTTLITLIRGGIFSSLRGEVLEKTFRNVLDQVMNQRFPIDDRLLFFKAMLVGRAWNQLNVASQKEFIKILLQLLCVTDTRVLWREDFNHQRIIAALETISNKDLISLLEKGSLSTLQAIQICFINRRSFSNSEGRITITDRHTTASTKRGLNDTEQQMSNWLGYDPFSWRQ